MRLSDWMPYVLFSAAAVALVAAVWFAARHPESQRPARRPAWQVTQACLAGLAASAAALCVLSGLSLV